MVKTETKWHNSGRSGFTLLELLVVVGILAALVALALPFYQDYVNQSKITAAEADLQTFKKALAMYDQVESTPFIGSNLLPLIGKYMQDYRSFAGQQNPVDPWGNDYYFAADFGVALSNGPNGTRDTVDFTSRISSLDDMLVTWKPPYFVSGARAINRTTVEVTFSRKVDGTPTGAFTPARTVVNVQKVSDTVFRFILDNATPLAVATPYYITVNAIAAKDGRATFDLNPQTGTSGAQSLPFTL